MRFIETKDGVILNIYVKPSAQEFNIKVEGDEVIVFCRSDPVKGKVNKELLKELHRLLDRDVELVSGFTSRQKKILVRSAHGSDVERILSGKGPR